MALALRDRAILSAWNIYSFLFQENCFETMRVFSTKKKEKREYGVIKLHLYSFIHHINRFLALVE